MTPSAVLLLGASIGWASPEAAVAVVPAPLSDARAEALRGTLADLGYPDVVLVPGPDFAAAAPLVRVVGLPGEDECDRRVPVDDWRRRFDDARARFQLLAFADALAELVALDVELVCLSSPPATSDLFRLELGLAEAHTFLSQSAGKDAGRRGFHEDEAARALRRAASFGTSLSAPADLAPEVLAAYDATRAAAAAEDPPRVVVTGPGARVGARFNGRPLPDIAFDAVAGANLVQAAEGATVTAAARLRLTDGRTLVWLAPAGTGPAGVAEALAAFADGRLDRDATALLAAAGRLVGDGAPVLYVEDGPAFRVWTADGDTLAEVLPDVVEPDGVDAWRFVLGVGPSAGWSSLGGGPLEGLAGPNLGVSLHSRVAVAPWIALALTVDPWAVGAPLPADQGGGTLMRATIPARLGVRFGRRTRAWTVDGGVDAGVHWFGVFDQGGEPVPRMSFLAGGAAGLFGALGPRVAARFQGWFGAGLGYVAGGASLGLEGRL